MTLDTENLPTLWRRLAILEGQYRYNLSVIGKDQTRADSVIHHENDDIVAEMDELRYVLRGRRQDHTDETKIGVPFHTLLTIGMVNGGFLALILYLLFQH